MLTIELKNKDNQPVIGRIDHEKDLQPLCAKGETMAVLAIKQYRYQPGDHFFLTATGAQRYFVLQLDETLQPSMIYLPESTWAYQIPTTEKARKAMVDTAFLSERHHVMVREAYAHEINNYQNVSFNAHDQKEASGAYPHAYANVETRDDAVFFAKNAIDGRYGHLSHGSYPFASWGINQQANAALTIDFGRPVTIDRIQLLCRADFPHDSYWQKGMLVFSDETHITLEMKKETAFQAFSFPEKTTTTITLKRLEKAPDDSPFPALTQIEAFGWHR